MKLKQKWHNYYVVVVLVVVGGAGVNFGEGEKGSAERGVVHTMKARAHQMTFQVILVLKYHFSLELFCFLLFFIFW